MNTNPWPEMRIDLGKHMRNKAEITPESLVEFWGKQVAWHADGTHVVASADTDRELFAELARLGIDVQDVVVGHVDDPREGNF